MKSAALQLDFGVYHARVARVLRAHRWLLVGVLCYCVLALLVAQYYGIPERLKISHYAFAVPITTGIYLFFFGLIYVLYVMVAVRPARLTSYVLREIGTKWLTLERLIGALVVVAVLQLFFSVFTSVKAMIPYVHPFAWDATLTEWDRMLHGGIDPWRLLQYPLGFPVATTAVNFLYQCWVFILYGFLVWQAFCVGDKALRMQFFLALVLVWVLLGNVAATLMSSAGPVYFGRVTGLDDPFVPLMDYLRAAHEVLPVWALEVQDRLWDAYATDSEQLGKGVSAMPSMHVAQAVLFALVAWRAHRALGWIFVAYAVVVVIGSVHLAWHYALDGYVAAVLSYALWRLAGWWVARDIDAAGQG